MLHRLQFTAISGFLLIFSASALGQAYQAVTVNNGGTISGTVKWSGPIPKQASLAITKDSQICDPEAHKTRDLERLIVGPDGGVANTVVFLKDIAQGKAMDLPPQRQFLDQKQCRYEPHILLVPATGKLQMKSSDAVLHTVHMDGAATYNLPFPFPNQIVFRDMNAAGLVNLKCNGGHTWMNAEMLVVNHPYYAVTTDSGEFKLTNVPPGQYEIVAWHEGWGVVRQEGSFDVLTTKRVERPVFTQPREWSKKVSVDSNGSAAVNFVLGEK
jgi:hypothetical protein